MANTINLTIKQNGKTHQIQAEEGSNLRAVLLENDLSPHQSIFQQVNCKGDGVCATCNVRITENAPPRKHWQDKASDKIGHGRLSCLIKIEEPMVVEI
ncbi:MAG: 2Fe-2S iron-sulfur cluster-binding protein [bacterium]